MGQHPSLQRFNPKEVFASPEEVRARLLDHLYQRSDAHRRLSLRDLFQEQCSQEGIKSNSDIKVTPAVWTPATFASTLAKYDPSLVDAFNDAAPLLYKLTLRHGAYPFRHTEGTQKELTLVTFITALAMLSHPAEHLADRCSICPRREIWTPDDRIRLYFQSIATVPTDQCAVTAPDDGVLVVDDDKDLLDVMENTMPPEEKVRYLRTTFKGAAALLPPSGAADQLNDAVVAPRDVRALIGLMVALAMRGMGFGVSSASLTWHEYTAEPCLLDPLRDYIGDRFGLRGYGRRYIHPDNLPPFRALVSSSKILSPPQTVQLLALLHVPHPAVFGSRVYAHVPRTEAQTQAQALSRLLQDKTDRLVLLSAAEVDADATAQHTFAIYLCSKASTSTSTSKYSSLPQLCSLSFSLAPRQRVLFSSSDDGSGSFDRNGRHEGSEIAEVETSGEGSCKGAEQTEEIGGSNGAGDRRNNAVALTESGELRIAHGSGSWVFRPDMARVRLAYPLPLKKQTGHKNSIGKEEKEYTVSAVEVWET
ncbi:uncharacterized protein K452DRAFT_313709 [Aplosporella prunicola CBS 121167]|uniref:TLDc domain-containing protein n=1 Tax=Aplosporella prunicola CBS 121167 TaxID=1176127 RepID=A0A6A6AX83_9PEZI|nr:uncharacterized protein K452DRAFT_313709 [Aplosporella prunicola CBS 121167]KAF2135793.1 hypothetical protein K452DRAFT_313709 [Aplosporella prunicola CBS 121167]